MRTEKLVWMAMTLSCGVVALNAASATGKQAFRVVGTYVEGCQCNAPCACAMIGLEMGCQGVGAMALTGGSFGGQNLAGAKIGYATKPGEWVRLYVDARNPKQRAAATAFAKSVFKDWGKLEEVKSVPVSITGRGGWYKVAVDGGNILQLTTKPVMGADKKRPIMHANVKDPLTSYFLQGKSVSGSFNDGGHSFKLKDTNSYFYPMKRSGVM